MTCGAMTSPRPAGGSEAAVVSPRDVNRGAGIEVLLAAPALWATTCQVLGAHGPDAAASSLKGLSIQVNGSWRAISVAGVGDHLCVSVKSPALRSPSRLPTAAPLAAQAAPLPRASSDHPQHERTHHRPLWGKGHLAAQGYYLPSAPPSSPTLQGPPVGQGTISRSVSPLDEAAAEGSLRQRVLLIRSLGGAS